MTCHFSPSQTLDFNGAMVQNILDETSDCCFRHEDFFFINLRLPCGQQDDIPMLKIFFSSRWIFLILINAPDFGRSIQNMLSTLQEEEGEGEGEGEEATNIDFVLMKTMVVIRDQFKLRTESLMKEVESIRQLVFVLSGRELTDFCERVTQAVRNLIQLRDSLSSKVLLLSKLSDRRNNTISNNARLFLHIDVRAFKAMTFKLQMLREMLEATQNNYITKVNNDLGFKADATNRILKLLSIVSVLLIPPTLLSGFFGMNVWYPGRIEVNLSFDSFGTILGMMAVIAVAQFIALWYYKLL